MSTHVSGILGGRWRAHGACSMLESRIHATLEAVLPQPLSRRPRPLPRAPQMHTLRLKAKEHSQSLESRVVIVPSLHVSHANQHHMLPQSLIRQQDQSDTSRDEPTSLIGQQISYPCESGDRGACSWVRGPRWSPSLRRGRLSLDSPAWNVTAEWLC